MAVLVRHDAAVEVVFPRDDTETLANAAEIARLYDALGRVSEQDNPRTARAGEARSRKN